MADLAVIIRMFSLTTETRVELPSLWGNENQENSSRLLTGTASLSRAPDGPRQGCFGLRIRSAAPDSRSLVAVMITFSGVETLRFDIDTRQRFIV